MKAKVIAQICCYQNSYQNRYLTSYQNSYHIPARIASWIARVIAWMGPQDSYLDSQTDSTIATRKARVIA